MNTKKAIRSQMKEKLSELPKPLYESYSCQIASNLYQTAAWKDAEMIGITISRFPEVDTAPIIKKAWEAGKKVAVPKCYPKEKILSFRILNDFSQLESVFYGLLEPAVEKTTEAETKAIDLLIVPGLAFTNEGYRIGFGGGYYDRFLCHFSGKTLSLAFPMQLVGQFPIDRHDIPVSKIITTDKVITVN